MTNEVRENINTGGTFFSFKITFTLFFYFNVEFIPKKQDTDSNRFLYIVWQLLDTNLYNEPE